MPKEANLLPNLRIDIPDHQAQTAGFTRDLWKQHAESVLIDNFAGVLDGFRVEVSVATINIFNGNVLGRDGQLLNNEDEQNATRSTTFLADATYFVEVEFAQADSNSDARAVWDPSASNGTDTSGDVLPTGREFSQTVATRQTQDWNIVLPVSTTGFEHDTDPDSAKVPVAVITVAGGVITGASAAPASSILAEDILLGATSLKLLDSRIFTDTNAIIIDPGGVAEAATMTANDRANGIITISAGTASAFAAGVRIEATSSPAMFLPERSTPALPTSGSEDARARLFQGNEDRGRLVGLDPTGTGESRSDVEIKNLKRYVDFLAGQLREVKWGAMLSTQVGGTAPPSVFAAVPRYYESAGGIAGARSCTVTVGDGVNSFGDFNVTTAGSARVAIQNAINEVTQSGTFDGGIVYVKRGVYEIADPGITIPDDTVLIGDGQESTIIRAMGTDPVFTIDGDYRVRFENVGVDIDVGGTPVASVLINNTVTAVEFIAQNCKFEGISVDTGSNVIRGFLTACEIVGVSTTTGDGDALSGDWQNTVFQSCELRGEKNVADNSAINLFDGSDNVRFLNCLVSTTGALATEVIHVVDDVTGTLRNVVFDQCQISGGAASVAWKQNTGNGQEFKFRDCKITTPLGFGDLLGRDDLHNGHVIAGCTFAVPQDGTGLTVNGSTGTPTQARGVTVRDCTFTQAVTDATDKGVGLFIQGAIESSFSGCQFLDCDFGVVIQNAVNTQITNINIRCETAGRGRVGIANHILAAATNVWTACTLSNITISGLDDDSTGGVNGELAGILTLNAGAGNTIRITATTFSNIAIYDIDTRNNANQVIASGISLNDSSADISNPLLDYCSFTNITIRNILAETVACGFRTHFIRNITITGWVLEDIGTSNGSAAVNNRAFGIRFTGATQITLSNCNFNKINNTLADGGTTVNNFAAGLAFEDDTTEDILVNNCTFNVDGSTTFAGIRCTNQADKFVITNCIFDTDSTAGIGYAIHFTDAFGISDLQHITIRGNHIVSGVGDWDTGILIDMIGSVSADGHVIVCDNTLFEYANSGIVIQGGATLPPNFIVSNNSLYTTQAVAFGIRINDCTNVVVHGNVIDHNETAVDGVEQLIHMDDCILYAITGNFASYLTNNALADGIDTNGALLGLVAANFSSAGAGGGTSFQGNGGDFYAANRAQTGGISAGGGTEVAQTSSNPSGDQGCTAGAVLIYLNEQI